MKIKSLKIMGIKNIDKEISIDFLNKSTVKAPNESNVKIIYGPNGSGKTAIIEALSMYTSIVFQKNYLGDSINKKYLNHLINQKLKFMTVEIEIVSKKYLYKHYLKIVNNDLEFNIIEEQFYINNKEYLSVSNGIINKVDTKFRGIPLPSDELLENAKNTLDTRSILNYIFFEEVLMLEKISSHVLSSFLVAVLRMKIFKEEKDDHNEYFAKQNITKTVGKNSVPDQMMFDHYVSKVSDDEIRIYKEDFTNYEKKISNATRFLKIFKPNLSDIEIVAKENEDYYIVDLIFIYDKIRIDLEFESVGIKKLLSLHEAISQMDYSIVIIDEIDAHLHDVVITNLIEYIMEYTMGQLIATSHNLFTMDTIQRQKKSITFIDLESNIYNWANFGNQSARTTYQKGLIPHNDFGYSSFEFVDVFSNE